MATLDASIVNIALPTLTKALQTELSSVKWVIIAYLLSLTCLLLPFGRLSDRLGRRKMFLAGYLLFISASALCAFAPSLKFLVFARVLQGAGAALLMSNGPAVVTAAFPDRERGKALGVLAMMGSAGMISGPGLGGLLIANLGWPVLFWVNVPIGILGALLVRFAIPCDAKSASDLPRFDFLGAILQVILLLGFIIWVDPPMISLRGALTFPVAREVVAAVTLAVLALFLMVELDADSPVFDLELLAERTFWTSSLASFLVFSAYSAVTVMMPFFLEEVYRLTPSRTGGLMMTIPLVVLFVAPWSGRYADRGGGRRISCTGAGVGGLALLLMAGIVGPGLVPGQGLGVIVAALGAVGLAYGLFQSPNNRALMSAVPADKLGTAAAMVATFRNLGLVTGTGLATALFEWRMGSTRAFVPSFHFVLGVAGALACAGGALAFLRRGEP
jgi:EmrB/QacA subfamily drug resistance transporter